MLANLTLNRGVETLEEVQDDLLSAVLIAKLRDELHEAITVQLHGLLRTLLTSLIILL
jgi:hypothetical protein